MELGLDSSSMTCPLGLSLNTSSIINSSEPPPSLSSFDHQQSSDSVNDCLVSLSLRDTKSDGNGGGDGDLMVERESAVEEEIEDVSRSEESEKLLNSGIYKYKIHTEIAADKGGNNGDRVAESGVNEENTVDKLESEASEEQLSSRSSNYKFHAVIAADKGGNGGDHTVVGGNNEENVVGNQEIEETEEQLSSRISSYKFHAAIAAVKGVKDDDRMVEKENYEENAVDNREDEDGEKELSCRNSSNRFHAVIAVDNVVEDCDHMVEIKKNEENAEEKQEFENVIKSEDGEKDLSSRRSYDRFQTEIDADNKVGKDGDGTLVYEYNEENAEEKREIENVSKNEDSEKEMSGRRSSTRFPVRPEAENCTYFLKTGTCKFGMNCKFNHPPNHRKCQGVKVKTKDECVDTTTKKVKEKAESVDKEQIDCKYFDRPGGCKFGKACKFNHSRRTDQSLKLNFMGLPIRLGEKECPFYMRNGSCKFGANCRFNHPDPTSVGEPDALPRYDNGGSIFSSNALQSTLAPWSPPTTLNESSPYVPLMFSPTRGVPMQSEWNAYQAPVYPPERNIHIPPMYGMNSQLLEKPKQVQGDEFPERPGQPECSYFLRNGDCKYRSACKFHHPKSEMAQSLPCLYSDLGLPLRPGENVCSYYNRYGICKYGPACKYDHPINHAHSSELTVSAIDQTPVLDDPMVKNQAMAAES